MRFFLIVGCLCLWASLTGADSDFATMTAGRKDLRKSESGPFPMRGYGTLGVKSASWSLDGGGRGAVAVFSAETPEKAALTASKYLADLCNYGPVQVSEKKNATEVTVRHGGVWRLGVRGTSFYVCSAPDSVRLDRMIRSLHLENMSPVVPRSYPKYLDNFDNAALAIWWAPNKKSPKEMEWMKENPVIANLHYATLDFQPAPNVLDTKGPENAIHQLRSLGKPFRTMGWTGTGKNAWFSWMNLPGQEFEGVPEGFVYRNYFEANGYYGNQAASRSIKSFEFDALERMMNRFKNDPDLLAWMEPHGEFQLFAPPTVPSNAVAGFQNYLRNVRKYTLKELAKAWNLPEGSFRNWSDIPYPDEAWFKGRRGHFLDLDSVPWKWESLSFADGRKTNVMEPSFDDASWFTALRTDKRLLGYTSPDRPLWTRFRFDIPASFLAKNEKVYLHILPYTFRKSTVSVWVNGKNAALDLNDPDCYENRHSEVEISKLLKSGQNQFTIFSSGGRIAYRVFLNHKKADKYPFPDPGINRYFVDWRDYLNHTKFETLKETLAVMRSIDPIRPIKVMTPNQWLSDAQDLFERYGAYPQLTGECSWYRPMHYKGYTHLRNRLSSSEPGGPVSNRKDAQVMYAMAFFESQDCHDYGFDFSRDFWRFPEVVGWWTENKPLLRTFGKTNLVFRDLGLLRDTLQDNRYDNAMIWNWDLSRGPLPSLGLTPVLVDGKDLEKGLADESVKVLFDCATIVMTDKLVDAVQRYVRKGGVFIAQHHTGRHSENVRDSWILPKAFGLNVTPRSKFGKIRFTETQTLFPSLKGRFLEGSGSAITHLGEKQTGAVGIQGKATPVAFYDDGTMAIAEVNYGKGRFLFLGSPFYYSCKDDQGKWMNEESRQAILAELLSGVGIRRETFSSDPRIWFDKRASKNGLYDVYFGGGIGFRGNWTLEDRSNGTLSILRNQAEPAVDVTSVGMPDVKTEWKNGTLSFGTQKFSPYQIRQFAVVREDAGRNAPVHWLDEQRKAWYALAPVRTDSILKEARETVEKFRRTVREDGIDLSSGWEAAIDSDPVWRKASMGTWDVQGWIVQNQVRYRKTVKLPSAWQKGNHRIHLGFFTYKGHGTLGIYQRASLRIDGKTVADNLQYEFNIPLNESVWKKGSFELELVVFGKTDPGKASGPWGSMYLRKMPLPDAVISLNGTWDKFISPLKKAGTVTVPFRGKLFGLERRVVIPESWKGKIIRLQIRPNRNTGIVACILNEDGYFRENDFFHGMRVDRYLKPGQENRILLLTASHDSKQPKEEFVKLENIQLEAVAPEQ